MGFLWLGHKKLFSFHLIHKEQSSFTPKTAIWKGHIYTAPVDSPRWACPATVLAQAPDMTKEAMLEVDLPAQMVSVIFKLDCLWHRHIYHTYAVKSVVKEHQHLLLCGGATVSTHFTDISVLERRPVAIQAPGHPLRILQKDLRKQIISSEVSPTNGEIQLFMQMLWTPLLTEGCWQPWVVQLTAWHQHYTKYSPPVTPGFHLPRKMATAWTQGGLSFKSAQAIIFYQVVQGERTRQANSTL